MYVTPSVELQDPAERASSQLCRNTIADQGDGDAQPHVCRARTCEELYVEDFVDHGCVGKIDIDQVDGYH